MVQLFQLFTIVFGLLITVGAQQKVQIPVPGYRKLSWLPSSWSKWINRKIISETTTATRTVNVQFLEPAGLMVWTSDHLFMEMLKVELLVGQNNVTARNFGIPIWDRQFVSNTTVPTDGKFMITNHDMVINKNDIIRLNASVLYDGSPYYSKRLKLIVKDNFFFRPRNNLWCSHCPTNHYEHTHTVPASLKTILEKKIMDCIGSEATENLIFHYPYENKTAEVDYRHFVTTRLKQIEGLGPLADKVVSANLAQNGVRVRMKTVIDKFMVLVLGEGIIDVVDFDSFVQEKPSNDTSGEDVLDVTEIYNL